MIIGPARRNFSGERSARPPFGRFPRRCRNEPFEASLWRRRTVPSWALLRCRQWLLACAAEGYYGARERATHVTRLAPPAVRLRLSRSTIRCSATLRRPTSMLYCAGHRLSCSTNGNDYPRRGTPYGAPSIATIGPRSSSSPDPRLPRVPQRIVEPDAFSASACTRCRSRSAVATGDLTDKPAKRSTQVCRDILTRLWVLDPLPAWLPSANLICGTDAGPQAPSRRPRAGRTAAWRLS